MLKTKVIHLLYRARRNGYRLRLKFGKHTSAHILAARCGFFGNMFMTLHGIRLCETANVHPQPYWAKESLFFEEVYGSNVWDYYFKTIKCAESTAPGKNPPRIAFKPDAILIKPYAGFSTRETYNRYIEKYVKLQDHIYKEILLKRKCVFEKRHILGVHARFTDAQAGFEKRLTAAAGKYFQAIDNYMENESVNGIFLATDSNPALLQFKKRYGNLITAMDSIRSNDSNSIHGHYDKGTPGSPYIKGLEVIRDAYLLSYASHLICTDSKIATYSLCLNPLLKYTKIGINF